MIYLFRETWKYVGKDKWKVILFFTLHFISLCGQLIKPYAFGRAIDALTIYGIQDLEPAIWWLGLYLLGFFQFELFHRSGQYLLISTALSNKKRFVGVMYERINQLPMAWHAKHHSGDLVSRIQVAGDAIRDFSFEMIMYLELFVFSVGPILILVSISWQIALICLVMTLVNAIIVELLNRKIEVIMVRQAASKHEFTAKLIDLLGNIKSIITLKVTKETKLELDKQYDVYYTECMNENAVNQPRCFIMGLTLIVTELVVIAYYLWDIKRIGGALLVGTLVMIVNYYRQMSDTIQNFMGSIYETLDWKASLKSVGIVTEAFDLGNSFTDNKIESVKWQDLEISHINFKYEDGHGKLVDNSLALTSRSKIAIVGESGCGKSTFLSVLAGIYEADRADYKINGCPVSKPKALHKEILFAFQEPEIFNQTLAYNISLGKKISKSQMNEYIKLAKLEEVIKRLPKGYETKLMEKGVNLSGGEKQRIVLARNLFFAENKSILLLDEVTSQVDAMNEKDIFDKLMTVYEGKALISTIHRLHLLDLFDEVIVMEDGKMIQRGEFQQLIKVQGKLMDMWSKYQVGGEELFS